MVDESNDDPHPNWQELRPSWPSEELDDTWAVIANAQELDADDEHLKDASRSVRFARELGKELGAAGAPFPGDDPGISRVLGRFSAGLLAIRQAAERSEDRAPALSLGVQMLNDALAEFVELMRRYLEESVRDRVGPLLDIFSERLRARELVFETEGARDVARQAAGAAGESALAAHFGNYAARERTTANRLRLLSVAALLAVTAFAAVLLFRVATKDTTTGLELAKLTLTLPLAALAAYLAREASNHRAAAQWASVLEVQLLTVDAYTAPLGDTLRSEIRAELGRHVFTSYGPRVERDQIELAPTILTDTTDVARKVTDLAIKTSKGPGGSESP
jgi:hypothetical protein